MPLNVGKYQQGNITTHEPWGETDMDPDDMPHRASPAGPVPQSPQWEPAAHTSAPNNDGHKV